MLKEKIFPFTLIVLASFFIVFAASAEEPVNYCKDPKSWVEWDDLVEKYPNDQNIQILHALRIGLCAKIEQGSITFDMANEIFKRAHEMVYRQAEEERERLKQEL